MNLHFAHPGFLALLLVLPAWLVWYVSVQKRHQPRLPLTFDPRLVSPARTRGAWVQWVPRGLMLVGYALCVLALARPQREQIVTENFAVGVNLMLALDVSESMETTDMPPNRLEAAKQVAIRFVEGLHQDRLGVVLFAEAALVYAPLTLDYAYLADAIRDLRPGVVPKKGTAMGEAIGVCLNTLDAEVGAAGSAAIILVTDGANNRGELGPRSAASVAKQRGIRVYTIAMGNPTQQLNTGAGQTREVYTEHDAEALQAVARISGGRHFSAADPGALGAIFEDIARLEKSRVGSRFVRQTVELFWPYLAWGVGLILLGYILSGIGFGNPLMD